MIVFVLNVVSRLNLDVESMLELDAIGNIMKVWCSLYLYWHGKRVKQM
ncbi:MAG: hypothetical protein JJT76_11390 [Clostridiaceae bacterium]|nr:hypothetical protein [Clostridiaceae bacterium]